MRLGGRGTAVRFRDLPRPAKVLVVGMCLVGAATLTWGLFLPPPRDAVSGAVLVGLAFLVASTRVEIHPRVASIQLGFVFVFAALFGCGTSIAMAATVANALGAHVLRPRSRPAPAVWSTAYNAAALVVSALAAGLAYERLLPAAGERLRLQQVLSPALVAVGVYYAGTIVAVGLVSTLSALRLPPRRWWAELAALAPAYAAGGAAALALDAAVKQLGHWVFVVGGLPFAYVIHQSCVAQGDKLAEEVKRLEERAEASEGLARLYRSVLKALANAIDAKDHGTHLHTERVQALTAAVAQRLGLGGDDLKALDTAAILHDIGKLAVPDHVLLKPGRLSDDELRLMQGHTAAGEAILQPIDFGVDVASIVRHHHEKADGSGYPDGLSGEEIPMSARILAVVDVYDALASDRPYRKAWTRERAMEYLREEAGRSFDARVVEALVDVLESEEFAQYYQQTGPEPVLAFATTPPATPGDDANAARQEVQQHAANCILKGAVNEVVGRGAFEACVAYQVSESSGEMDAVAMAGDFGGHFERTRVQLGVGPSGQAAATGQPVYSARAVDDLLQFAQDIPPTLSEASVTAIPILSSTGSTLAVLSFYLGAGAAFTECLSAEANLAAALLGRQMEWTSQPTVPVPTEPQPVGQ